MGDTPVPPAAGLTSPSMEEVLRDARVEPRPQGKGDQAAALLRAHVLQRVSAALARQGRRALVVKGAALALTTYREPAARPMCDIDLLVAEGELDGVVAALVAEGRLVETALDRRESSAFFGETLVELRSGSVAYVVEVHTTLDKLARRPVDLAGVFARARPLAGLPALLSPVAEDHALLVALHAAGHELRHPAAWLDLELLFRRGLDFEVLARRAHEWKLDTVMFVALDGLRQLGAASIREMHVRRFAPSASRRLILRRSVEVTTTPSTEPVATGLPWVLRQAMFHDDLVAWSRDVVRYGRARITERTRALFRSRAG